MSKRPLKKKWETKELLEIVHSDICGPMRVKTHNKMEYFISFIDDFSRFGYVYLIVHKSQALEKFKEYKKEVETQLGRSIKGLNTDRGGEYTSEFFKEYCKENGIRHVNTMPYIPK